MAKKSFRDAVEKSNSRRSVGYNKFTEHDDSIRDMARAVEAIHSGDSQSTTAIGYLDTTVYVAKQGGRPSLDDNDKVQLRLAVGGPVDSFVIVNDFVQPQTGLHAEMMIVRYLCKHDNIAKNLLWSRGLKIAVTKGCCLDCAGWLNTYLVPHNTPRKDPKPSNQWLHPITLSTYQGARELNYYKAQGRMSLGRY